VQKALYPEGPGVCHAIVLHPPAGIAGGDQLEIRVEADAGAHALLTTPGAGKWYRSSGAQSSQRIHMKVGAGATAEWLPQESIVFSGAQARMRTVVELEQERALYRRGNDLLRPARQRRELRQRPPASGDGHSLRREAALARTRRDRGRLGPARIAHRPCRLQRLQHVADRRCRADAGSPAACRTAGSREAGAQWGVSLLPQLLVGRYLGHSAEAAREWLMQLWAVLRPAMSGREAIAPRIWNT
jgi:urease accessory protein